MDNSRLVYSTETGSVCALCRKPVSECTCKKKKSRSRTNIKYDGIIRIQREVKGRKAKTVTTVSGFQLDGLLRRAFNNHHTSAGADSVGTCFDHRHSCQPILDSATGFYSHFVSDNPPH